MVTSTENYPHFRATVKFDASPQYGKNYSNIESSNDVEELTIDLRYKDYRQQEDGQVIERCTTITLLIEDDLDWDNIEEGDFGVRVDGELEELGVEEFARSTAAMTIAETYFDMIEEEQEGGNNNDVGPRAVAMLVNIEVHDFIERPKGVVTPEMVRKFLGRCNVNLSVSSSSESSQGCCAICLDEVGGGGKVVDAARLPCFHVFHGDCLVKMVVKCTSTDSLACPLCRSSFFN